MRSLSCWTTRDAPGESLFAGGASFLCWLPEVEAVTNIASDLSSLHPLQTLVQVPLEGPAQDRSHHLDNDVIHPLPLSHSWACVSHQRPNRSQVLFNHVART